MPVFYIKHKIEKKNRKYSDNVIRMSHDDDDEVDDYDEWIRRTLFAIGMV